MKELKNDEDKVWLTITRKVNLGNYESYDVQAGYSVTVKEGENPMDLLEQMETELQPFVNKKARLIKKKNKL